jgi:hypothetical protein
MKSITIHGLTDQLDRLIRKRAKKHGTSLNKTIKRLLEESFGINKQQKSDHREDFMDLFGIWDKAEKKKFNDRIKDFDTIDEVEWQ